MAISTTVKMRGDNTAKYPYIGKNRLNGRIVLFKVAGRGTALDNGDLKWANPDATLLGGSYTFADIFNVPHEISERLYVCGTLSPKGGSSYKVRHAPLAKLADVIDRIVDGMTVDEALISVFKRSSFTKVSLANAGLTPA